MLTHMRKLSLATLAVAALTVLGACASASESGHYAFEIVGQSHGSPLAIRLVDKATGHTVLPAQMFAVHTMLSPPKASRQEMRTPLEQDGHGNFLYPAERVHAGDTLQLAASIAGEDRLIRGSVDVPKDQ